MTIESGAGVAASSLRQLLLPLDVSQGKTFDNFVSTGNEALVETLKHLCMGDMEQGRQLYVWGDASTGKSHLLQAACQFVNAHGGRSAWLPLTRLLVHGPRVLVDFATVNLIGIDELDAIVGKFEWQRALFALINEARVQKCRLVMASRQNPATSEWQLKDLPSRLVWGAVYRLVSLDDVGKAEVLQNVVRDLGYSLEESVLAYLFNNYSRELEGLVSLIKRLSDHAKKSRKRITVPFVKEVLLSEKSISMSKEFDEMDG